jgi:hypothetical protein
MHTELAHSESTAEASRPAASGGAARLRGAALVLSCGTVLAVAVSLTPRASGQGTHQELGLPACSFLVQTGYPCPSCGLTTSVVAMAHGQIRQAFRAQPFGAVLFMALVVLAVVGLTELTTGRNVIRLLRPGLWWVAVGLGGMLLGWGWKLAWGCATGQYPLH